MRLSFAAVIVAGVAFMSGPAQAATGQCFDRNGQPSGPLYDTDHPDQNFHTWIARRGGVCRAVSWQEAQALRNRRIGYPGEYSNPGYVQPQPPSGYDAPPANYGDIYRRNQVVTNWFYNRGRPQVQILDTNRVEYHYNRSWQILRVRYLASDGRSYGETVGVRLNRQGQYVLIHHQGGGNWTGPAFIGS